MEDELKTDEWVPMLFKLKQTIARSDINLKKDIKKQFF